VYNREPVADLGAAGHQLVVGLQAAEEALRQWVVLGLPPAFARPSPGLTQPTPPNRILWWSCFRLSA